MNNEEITKLYENYGSSKASLEKNFGKYKSGRKLRVAMKNVLATVISAIALLLVFLLVERTPIQSEFLRYLFATVLYIGLIWRIFRFFNYLFHSPSDVALAVEIENSTGRFNSLLSSAVEFMKDQDDSRSISALMKKLTVASAGNELKSEDVKLSLKAFSRRNRVIASLILVALAAGWYFLSPVEFKVGAYRLAFPMASIAPWTNLILEITPRGAVAAVGDSLEISVVPSRDVEEAIVLELLEPDKKEGTKVEMYPDANASGTKLVYNLTSLQSPVDYVVRCERVVSERYRIAVMPRPQVKSVEITLMQPEYISAKPVKVPAGNSTAEILADSKARIDVESDQPLISAEICFVNGATETCQVVDNKFSYEFQVATTTSFFFVIHNEINLTNDKPVVYTLTAKPDLPPAIELLKPGCDVEFPTTRRLDIKAVAHDDFGVKTMVLHYKAGHRDDWKPKNMKSDFKAVPEFEVEYPWMLDTLAVQPGTKVSYYVEAEDARQPHPNVASTAIFFVNMPSMQDIYKGEDTQQADFKTQLDEFVKDQQMRSEALKKAYEQIKHEEKLDFETSQAIEKAIESGEKSQKEAEELLKSFEGMKQAMQDNPFTSMETMEKMEKIGDLMNELLDEKTKSQMQKLRESLKDIKLDPKDIQKYEEAFKLDDYMKSLDRTINLLEQVREQKKFESLANSIEEMLERQKQIASETAELNKKQQETGLTKEEEDKLKDLQDQQNKLNQDLSELQKKSEEMTKNAKKEDFQNNPLMEDVKNILDRMKDNEHQKIGEDIKNDMENKNLEGAQQNQEKMLNFLEALKKNADNMQMTMSGSQMQQLDLSDYIRRAVQVSRDQEALYNEICDMPESFMRDQIPQIEGTIDFISVQQVLVKQQGLSLQEDLEELVRKSFGIDPTSTEIIKGTQGMFSNIVKNLEDRAIGSAWSDQLEIIRRFNKLAVDLMRAQDNSGQGGSGSSMSPMQQFKNLTQRQLSLYQQMMKQQLMPQGSEALKKMAMEQRHIRESLEQLMREHKNQMNSLGRMNDVIDDMKDLETKILDPSLRQKVAEKQKSIYERMLKSQKAIKNRDEEDEEERKAQKARELHQMEPDKPIGDIGSGSVDLSKDFTGDLREDYPQSYKNLINDYYKSLNIYGGDRK